LATTGNNPWWSGVRERPLKDLNAGDEKKKRDRKKEREKR
jgi:hypothetical protein